MASFGLSISQLWLPASLYRDSPALGLPPALCDHPTAPYVFFVQSVSAYSVSGPVRCGGEYKDEENSSCFGGLTV